MLYDLQSDPQELVDLGGDASFAADLSRLQDAHFQWTRRHHTRTTLTAENVDRMAKGKEPPGILIGFWDSEELAAAGRPLPINASG